MSKFLTLLKREVAVYLRSPIGYVVMFFFLALGGLSFWFIASTMTKSPSDYTLLESFLFFVMLLGVILVFPLLTMRLFSEEFKMGTIEPLMTAPVRDWQVVLSKYLASLFFYVLLWAPTGVYYWLYNSVSSIPAAESPNAYVAAYLFVFLLGACFLSIGLFCSSLTSNQIVAAVMCFAITSVMLYGGMLATSLMLNVNPVLNDFVDYFSTMNHMGDFFGGVVDSRQVVLYGSTTLLMLFLTHQVVQYRRWKA